MKSKIKNVLFFLVCILVAFNCIAGQNDSGPVLVLGLDGLEWDFLMPLIKEGKLPNMVKLMNNGYYGKLETLKPTISPAIWTSIATGKSFKKHGIRNFIRKDARGGVRVVQSFERKTKAIWNIFSDFNLSTWSIGWWLTFPVENIKGIMIAQTNTLPDLSSPEKRYSKIWKGTYIKGIGGQVFPAALEKDVFKSLNEVNGALSGYVREIFGEFRYPLPPLEQRLWDNCMWAFRADTLYFQSFMKLAKTHKLPDLTLLYLGGPDVVGHRFLRYQFPQKFKYRPSMKQISNLGSVIDDYYIYCDGILGKLKDIFGPDATIFIISDHGMKPANLNHKFDPNDLSSPHTSGDHQNKPPGVIMVSGPGIARKAGNVNQRNIKKKDLKAVCSVLDITPTILALKQVPIGEDMDGAIINDIFIEGFLQKINPRTIPTHDTKKFMEKQRNKKKHHTRRDDKKRLEQLKNLGYID